MILRLSVLSLAIVCASLVVAQEKKEPARWRLTFEDNFDQPALNTKIWNPVDPWGAEKNGELQAYVPNAFEIHDGILHIVVEKRRAFFDGKTREYASGIASTYGKFSQAYGRFEIRCKSPKGKGLWPAFWMVPFPLDWPPEIDVVEILGKNPTEVHMTHHWKDGDSTEESLSNSKYWSGPDFSEDFHTFAVEWDPDQIVWLVDGVERHRSTENIPSVPMFLLVNLALGGEWAGTPDEDTPFPSSFQIDYVRVYERVDPSKK